MFIDLKSKLRKLCRVSKKCRKKLIDHPSVINHAWMIATFDYQTEIKKISSGTIIQCCLVHIHWETLIWLTKNLQSKTGIELRQIIRQLHLYNIHYIIYNLLIQGWHKKLLFCCIEYFLNNLEINIYFKFFFENRHCNLVIFGGSNDPLIYRAI